MTMSVILLKLASNDTRTRNDKLKILVNDLRAVLLPLMDKTLFNCQGNRGDVGNN